MENKRDSRFFIVPVLVFFVFLFSIIGYHQLMGVNFSFFSAIYSTLFFFILNNINPAEAGENPWLLIARYLAAVMLGFGIYNLLYSHIYRQFRKLKIKLGYRDHIIVFSMKMVGVNFLADMLENKYKVLLVEPGEENPEQERLEKNGVIVFRHERYETKLFDTLAVGEARTCVIAFGDDSVNIEIALKLIKYLQGKSNKHGVRILTHIKERSNLEVIKDYIDMGNADAHFELEVFNINSAAAKKIYDQYPPHSYMNFENPADENAIAVVGYNTTAEDFIIENIILSHYKDCKNIRVYLVDKEADNCLNHFMYKYPFCREFIDLVPVKLLNNKFFANFNWSKELIEKLSKVKAIYLFGNEGAELMNTAVRFRQFLSGQATTNYLVAPVIICFPEDTNLMNLLNIERANREKLSNVLQKQLNVHLLNMVSDTCTSSRLLEESEYIDLLSRVINYFYCIKYELALLLKEKLGINDPSELILGLEKKVFELANTSVSYTEKDIEHFVLQYIADATHKTKADLQFFTIRRCWQKLSYHKKSANRYAARHMSVKLNIMTHIGCMPLNHENILNSFPVIAPIEHKRWSAEKMVLNYRYGILPKETMAKNIAKDLLKIHDQLIPYEKLTDVEKEKDLNIFLLMPLLNSLKVEIKK